MLLNTSNTSNTNNRNIDIVTVDNSNTIIDLFVLQRSIVKASDKQTSGRQCMNLPTGKRQSVRGGWSEGNPVTGQPVPRRPTLLTPQTLNNPHPTIS